MKNQLILLCGSSKFMKINLKCAKRIIFPYIIDVLIVVRPNCFSGTVADFIGINFTCFKILEVNRVNSAPDFIIGITRNLIVRAHGYTSDLEKFLAFRKNIRINQNFLFIVQRLKFSRENRIFLSFLVAYNIPVLVEKIRQRLIIFLVARLHFLEKFFLKFLRVFHDEVTVSVFSFKVFLNFGVFPLVHPEITVGALIAVNFQYFICFFCYWGLHFSVKRSNL